MTTFFAGNSKTILIKKQVDANTPVTVWTDAMALRVYEWNKGQVRAISKLDETDRSAQAGSSHVSAVAPAVTFGIYGRPSELDLIAEALLGSNDDSTTASPTTHEATPSQNTPYFSILEVEDYAVTRYEGCRLGVASFTAQDTGQTELRVTGLAWMAKTVTHGVATPSPMPEPVDELPFIYAEATVKYAGASQGRTSQFTWNINRNLFRAQGDNGFEALDLVNTKIQGDGTVTRYLADDDTLRAVDTGTTGGTVPTSLIFTEGLSVLFSRAAGAEQFLIASPEVAYETHEVALNLDGAPAAEAIGFSHEPQDTLAEHVSIVTVNDKATTEG